MPPYLMVKRFGKHWKLLVRNKNIVMRGMKFGKKYSGMMLEYFLLTDYRYTRRECTGHVQLSCFVDLDLTLYQTTKC